MRENPPFRLRDETDEEREERERDEAFFGEPKSFFGQHNLHTPEGRAYFLADLLMYYGRAAARGGHPSRRQVAVHMIEKFWQRFHDRGKTSEYVDFASLVLNMADRVRDTAPESPEVAYVLRLVYSSDFPERGRKLDLEKVSRALAAASGSETAKGVSKWRAIADALASADLHVDPYSIEREYRKTRQKKRKRGQK